jgi:hypothetical protein
LDSTKGILQVYVSRGGPVDEAITFLTDIQDAYENLYALNLKIDEAKQKYSERNEYSWRYNSRRKPPALNPTRKFSDLVLPDEKLIVHRVNIGSPGIWEFIGTLNPLQQLREYAKERHERRKDKEWREAEEQRQMSLENQKREQEVKKAELENIRLENSVLQESRKADLEDRRVETSILQEQVTLLRSIGYSDEQIRKLFNAHYYKPLSRLDAHANSGLLESMDVKVVGAEQSDGEDSNDSKEQA